MVQLLVLRITAQDLFQVSYLISEANVSRAWAPVAAPKLLGRERGEDLKPVDRAVNETVDKTPWKNKRGGEEKKKQSRRACTSLAWNILEATPRAACSRRRARGGSNATRRCRARAV